MARNYRHTLFNDAVKALQERHGSRASYLKMDAGADGTPDELTAKEIGFIAARDSFYLATVSETGWPYVQHRGGPKGFIKVVDARTLVPLDHRGNRQYITLANLSENDRAFLFLLDPARRQRIKIWGRARMIENDAALIEQLFDRDYKAKPERAILFTIEAWDVNCSSHIVTRFTEAEIEEAFATVQARLAELEAENAHLRAAVEKQPAAPSE